MSQAPDTIRANDALGLLPPGGVPAHYSSGVFARIDLYEAIKYLPLGKVLELASARKEAND